MGSRSIGIAAAAAVALVWACGEPAAPELPSGPDAGPKEVVVSDCNGIDDGTKCGDGAKICVRGTCSDPACGDGIVTAPEECDLAANNGQGAGCETTCKFSCVSTDKTRNCETPDSCISATCDDAKHTCNAAAPKPTGASCGPNKFCKGVDCVAGQCGDAVTTAPEDCDNGAANAPGSGCETTCKFTCKNAATDCAPTPCNTATCTTDHKCATTPDASKNGQACGTGLECKDGACIAPGATCGNGIVETGEDCDFGTGNNGPGTGCETICKFSCTKSPNSCTDMNACRVAPTCETVTVSGKTGQKCVTGTTKNDGAVCGTGAICLAGICKTSACGDGFRDDGRGEQCDDGNVTKLDACSDQCKYEHDHRVISMKMQFDTSTCTANALGGAIGTFARTSFQSNLDLGIADGSVSALFLLDGDLTGQTGNVVVGNLSGAPRSTASPWTGTSDLDWWYEPVASSIDANRVARATLTGTYSGGALEATGRLNLITNIGGALANLAVSNARVRMPIGAVTTPTTAAGNAPPGHVASERLVSSLQSFATAGGTNLSSPTSTLCGNISAASLDSTLPPTSLLPGGENACVENYTTSNRLLDIIVNGCKVPSGFGFNVTAIKATQPDEVDLSVAGTAANDAYVFTIDGNKRVNGCTKNGQSAALATCLAAAAYSMSFKFATDRVIIK